jgi:alkanesulfonate monooxygenase SsuD/methylene tetrahydromethanopterin reductase-like flavin-dependent oxidoreductase (luciferase family)
VLRVRIGLALPHYDCSTPGVNPTSIDTVLDVARRAEAWGYDSLWVSDHLTWDLRKYGGDDTRYGVTEALGTLAALASGTDRARIGSLVLCEALRHPAVLAKSLATIDRISDGRVDVGIGAGWYEADYDAIGVTMPAPGRRITRLGEYAAIVQAMLDGTTGPVDHHGAEYDVRAAHNDPPAVQQPVPVFLGGKGDRLLATVARLGTGWNTCWSWTVDAYRERLEALERACERVGRDPSTISRSLGLYTLCGEDERDVRRRFERLVATSPAGVLAGVTLDDFRRGRLVGTADEVTEQLAAWTELGVETVIAGFGAVPFQLAALDDAELFASVSAKRASER